MTTTLGADLRPVTLSPLPEHPLVSVVVANHNYARYVSEAIESVLNQTYSHFEIVVCDDGSTDDSTAVIKSYAERDARVRLLEQSNEGQASALNATYCASLGEIISLLDADDYFHPEKLDEVVRAFQKNSNSGFFYHPVMRVNQDGIPQGKRPLTGRVTTGWCGPRVLRNGGMMPQLTPCSALSLRREIADRIFPINPDFRTAADGVIQRLAPLLTPLSGSDRALSYYRRHNTNQSNFSACESSRQVKTLREIRSRIDRNSVLWLEQQRYLASVDEHLAALLQPLESCLVFIELEYYRAKLLGSPDWRKRYRAVISHAEFSALPVALRVWFIGSRLIPRFAFSTALRGLWGQNFAKRVVGSVATNAEWALRGKFHVRTRFRGPSQ